MRFHSASSCRRPQAFTLVELLVVIGIIALLISILLPALNKAREQANTAKCAANMRSAVQALHIYINENRGWIPGPYTSGAIWRDGGGGGSIGPNDISTDETPLQNTDWISPTFGKTFKWPENDYQRLRQIYNVELKCPTNTLTFNSLFGSTGLSYQPGDLSYSSYSAVMQFHALPARDNQANQFGRLPPIVADMYSVNNNGLLSPPSGYAPMISKVGPPASKVYLVEGSRYTPIIDEGTFNAKSGPTSFNVLRYQRQGGNFMIGGPFKEWPDTPFQLYEGNSLAYTSKKLSPVARFNAWRHAGKMNLAFFDGHVEARAPTDSIQVKLYVPKGTLLNKPQDTYDPKDEIGLITD